MNNGRKKNTYPNKIIVRAVNKHDYKQRKYTQRNTVKPILNKNKNEWKKNPVHYQIGEIGPVFTRLRINISVIKKDTA